MKEHQQVEWKETWRDEYLRWICGFANAEGGVLDIGRNDKGLPDWTLARLLGKHPSSPFNPLLANAFFLSGYIESWGRGIEKIAHECAQHGIKPPDYDSGMSGLMLTFRASAAYLALINPKQAGPGSGGTTEKGSGKMSGKIVVAILENPEITIPELAGRLQRTERTIERLISRLKADEVIKRIGPDKGGHWEVLK